MVNIKSSSWEWDVESISEENITIVWDREIKDSVHSIIFNEKYKMSVNENDIKWLAFLNSKLEDNSLSEKERAYYNRILRVLSMQDLSEYEWHPINLVINKIINSDFFNWFDHIQIPQIVAEWETFDLFNFPEDHVARRPSDSYFLQKSTSKEDSILLRPHTSVMWYHYLIHWWWKEKLEENWDVKALAWWKVYRVDELDKTHHECFHQIDWLRITSKEKQIINQDTLKEVLWNTIKALFWNDINYRFNADTFPYTTDSLEVEVEYEWKWLEVLWAWVVHPTVLEKLWLDSSKYNWWAFGFGIERLVMALKKIPDIRILWSSDKRITKQWWNLENYKEVSNFPPVYKDISFFTWLEKFVKDEEKSKKEWWIELTVESEADLFEISWIIRDISWDAGDLIEEVKLIDIFENHKKFWDKKSVCIRITFRSLERTLTNEEINEVYFKIRNKLEGDLWYELR